MRNPRMVVTPWVVNQIAVASPKAMAVCPEGMPPEILLVSPCGLNRDDGSSDRSQGHRHQIPRREVRAENSSIEGSKLIDEHQVAHENSNYSRYQHRTRGDVLGYSRDGVVVLGHKVDHCFDRRVKQFC